MAISQNKVKFGNRYSEWVDQTAAHLSTTCEEQSNRRKRISLSKRGTSASSTSSGSTATSKLSLKRLEAEAKLKLARLQERQILERAVEKAERAALQLKLDQNEALGEIAKAEAEFEVWSETRSRYSQGDDTSILATAAKSHAFTSPRSSQSSANAHVSSLKQPSQPGIYFATTDNRRQLEPVHGSFIAKTSVDDSRQVSAAVQTREELSLCSSVSVSAPSFYSQAKGFNSLPTLPESSSAEMQAQHSSTMHNGKKARYKDTIAAVSHLSPSAQPYPYPYASQATLRVNSQHQLTEENSQNVEPPTSVLGKSVNHFKPLSSQVLAKLRNIERAYYSATSASFLHSSSFSQCTASGKLYTVTSAK